jgi:hypothetical protein
MRELGFLGGQRLREPNDLGDETVLAYAAAGRRPRTGALRETLCRHAIGAHGLERDRTARAAELSAAVIGRGGASPPCAVRRRLESIGQSPVPFTARSSCVTRMASAEVIRQ